MGRMSGPVFFQGGKAPVVRFFRPVRKEAGGELAERTVVCDTFAAFAVHAAGGRAVAVLCVFFGIAFHLIDSPFPSCFLYV